MSIRRYEEHRVRWTEQEVINHQRLDISQKTNMTLVSSLPNGICGEFKRLSNLNSERTFKMSSPVVILKTDRS